MPRITLTYQHNPSANTLLLERIVTELNRKGGFRPLPPLENNGRLPLCKEILCNSSTSREIRVYTKDTKNDPEMWIYGALDKIVGLEEVDIPYGICGFHKYLEDRGYETISTVSSYTQLNPLL